MLEKVKDFWKNKLFHIHIGKYKIVLKPPGLAILGAFALFLVLLVVLLTVSIGRGVAKKNAVGERNTTGSNVTESNATEPSVPSALGSDHRYFVDGSSSSTHEDEMKKTLKEREQMVYDILISNGITPAGACGIMGNISIECENYDAGVLANNGNTYGLFQWNDVGERRGKLKHWCYDNRMILDTIESQVSFALYEIEGGDPIAYRLEEYLKTTDDPYTAAAEFAAGFERCVTEDTQQMKYTGGLFPEFYGKRYQSLSKRISRAMNYYERYVSEETNEVSEITAQIEEPAILEFVDVFGQKYETVINENVPKTIYDDGFYIDNDRLCYEDDKYVSRAGIDVSNHLGKINWEKVKADGFEFAIIRLGYRGYGKEGNIKIDKYFKRNIEGAQKAGLDVGVYFFAQAINEEEAIEEAQFVIDNLDGYELQLPVVYDPESILDAPARTDDVSGEQFTNNTLRFCSMIQEAGYQPMVYSNMLWEAFELDLEKLGDIPIWYADYEPLPQTPYKYDMLQYSNTGTVSGIGTGVDLDIQFLKK